jgi:4-alpha-glucanotransferase
MPVVRPGESRVTEVSRKGDADGHPPPFPRASGVLLHPTSLPGGTLGPAAHEFVDWLAEAHQAWWQVLPLGSPDEHGSPYSSPSAFAGSPVLLAEPDADVSIDEVEDFVARHAYWIGGWAAFAGDAAIRDQVRFEREWGALRDRARARGVRILGDVPFYVAPCGADVREHPELFRTDVVAGVPPDDWSATGQLWGNPIYDWAALRREHFRWWVERFRRTFELVDAVRIDHFRGFVAYWAVAAGASDARQGRWRRGPGGALFEAVERELGSIAVVAENLGVITPPVEELRRRFLIPGCRVTQFELAGSVVNRPAAARRDDVVFEYTGTHDNDTTVGWWSTASEATRARVDRELARRGMQEERVNWKLIRLAFTGDARVAIVPAQDLLGLDTRARMNRPGQAAGNWRWRLGPGDLDAALAGELRSLTDATHRSVTT